MTVGGLTFVIGPSASDFSSLATYISVVAISCLPLERKIEETAKPRVVIVDDHEVVRQEIRHILGTQDDCYITLGAGPVDCRTISSGSIAISATYFLGFSNRSRRVRAAISPIFCSGCRTVVSVGFE